MAAPTSISSNHFPNGIASENRRRNSFFQRQRFEFQHFLVDHRHRGQRGHRSTIKISTPTWLKRPPTSSRQRFEFQISTYQLISMLLTQIISSTSQRFIIQCHQLDIIADRPPKLDIKIRKCPRHPFSYTVVCTYQSTLKLAAEMF